MISRRSVITFLLSLIILTVIIPISVGRALNAPVQPNYLRAGGALSCQDVVSEAMNAVQSSCDNLGRNKACYGNAQVTVEPNNGAALKFDAVGDRAAIQDIRKLITTPLDLQKGTWGLSLLKLQANLPDTVPGQNVTFLVFGDTSIENASGDMKAFYFSSALGTLNCNEVPRDAILVRSPNHVQVSFKANGVDITIASTIVLRAVPNQGMTVTLIEGHASVASPQGSQTLQPGQSVTVPLGGPNGLEPVGAPSKPVAARNEPALTSLVTMTGTVADPDTAAQASTPAATSPAEPSLAPGGAAVATTIDGCVTAVKGNSVVISGHTINAGSDPALKDAKIGDCFRISGILKKNNGNGVQFVLVKATPKGKLQAPSGQGNTNRNYGSNGGNGNNGNGNGNGGGNGSNAGGNGSGNANNANNGGGNGSNAGGNGGGNGNGNNGNGNGNGGGDGSNAGGSGGGNGNQK